METNKRIKISEILGYIALFFLIIFFFILCYTPDKWEHIVGYIVDCSFLLSFITSLMSLIFYWKNIVSIIVLSVIILSVMVFFYIVAHINFNDFIFVKEQHG
jgi:hypothetical protein